jgi:hypothetical protein
MKKKFRRGGLSMLKLFLQSIEPLKDIYQNDTFSYVFMEIDNKKTMLRGTLHLNVKNNLNLPDQFYSSGIGAGTIYLKDLGLTRENFIEELLSGPINIGFGDLYFPRGPNEKYDFDFHPFHDDGNAMQQRLSVLSIFGDEIGGRYNQKEFDWVLKGANPPYDGMYDLLSQYHAGYLRNKFSLDIVAFAAALIDESSTMAGEKASIKVLCPQVVEKNDISIGYRIINGREVIQRGLFSGDDLKWSSNEFHLQGLKTIDTKKGSIVHAIVSYKGLAQHHRYIGDPSSFQNSRRAIYETFDPACSELRKSIEISRSTKPNQNTFEDAVSAIIWMLGFSCFRIGRIVTDAPDILVGAPDGNYALVEVTTGILKENNKLANLFSRKQAARESLKGSNQDYIKLISIIVTSKKEIEIEAEIDVAEKMGILVIAYENIYSLLDQTALLQDANALFARAESRIASGMERSSVTDGGTF